MRLGFTRHSRPALAAAHAFCNLLAVAGVASAAASNESNPSIIVVPGAWQIDPTWDGFMAMLTGAGYETTKVTLPSVGISLTGGLDLDINATHAVLDPLLDEGKDVVILAHSLGGLIAANAVKDRGLAARKAAGKEGGVVQLIYTAAFMVPQGLSLFNLLGNTWFPWMNVTDGMITGDPDEIVGVGFNDLPTDEAEYWAQFMTWTSEKVFKDASEYSPWLDGITEAYIHTLQDNALPYATQLVMAAQLPLGSSIATINSSHVPFLSHPDELLTLVEEAIAAGVEANAS